MLSHVFLPTFWRTPHDSPEGSKRCRWRLDDETVTTVTENEQASCDKAEATEGGTRDAVRRHGGRDLPTGNPKRIGIIEWTIV